MSATGAALAMSVVIVSHGRPAHLRRCILGVAQLLHPNFELIVVADAAGRRALDVLPEALPAKIVACDEPNISIARNLGIAAAAGEVVAFIDDDAVPEPTWLNRLGQVFSDPSVAAAGGFVRGRNGISWQSRASWVDTTGATGPLRVDPARPTVLTPPPGRAVKTEGTNMAVRRAILRHLGGFDERLRFFLDDTDLNLRLAEAGQATALVPQAEVHHGFAASPRRSADRVPRDLFEIGASWAVFLAKHCPDPGLRAKAWQHVQASERRRALGHMQRGTLEPRDVGRLMATLVAGYQSGAVRRARSGPEPVIKDAAFARYPAAVGARSIVVAGRTWNRRSLQRQARTARDDGSIVTLVRLSPTALFHRVRFTDRGIWEQTGGLFGRSDRSQRLFQFWRFRHRVAAEVARVAKVRALSHESRENGAMM
jgi:GT2 family glycosyltransferase